MGSASGASPFTSGQGIRGKEESDEGGYLFSYILITLGGLLLMTEKHMVPGGVFAPCPHRCKISLN